MPVVTDQSMASGPLRSVISIYKQQQQFRLSQCWIRGLVGGRGCVAAETMIDGEPIAEITAQKQVRTLFGAQASWLPFLKGRADLYRVATRSGRVVVVTDGHRFLTPVGWRSLRCLYVGALVAADDSGHEPIDLGKSRGYPIDCRSNPRFDGELCSPAEVAGQDKLRQLRRIVCGGSAFWDRSCAFGQLPPSTAYCPPLVSHILRAFSVECRAFAAFCESLRHRFQASRQFAGKTARPHISSPQEPHRIESLEGCFHPCPRSIRPLVLSGRLANDLCPSCGTRHDCSASDSSTIEPYRACRSESRHASGAGFPAAPKADISFGHCGQETCQSDRQLPPADTCELHWLSAIPLGSWDEITSVKFVKQGEFYDLHVPFANHYSAHGLWHHNTGKSTIGALDIIRRAKAGQSYMAVSPSYGVMEETTWPIFQSLAEELGVWIRGIKSPLPKARFRTTDGGVAEVVFRSGEKPEKLRGPSKAGLWLDEPSIMPKAVFDIGMPVLRDRGKMGWLSMTFTPKGRRHWTYEVFFERKGAIDIPKRNTELIHARSVDNPFLPAEFVDLIRDQYTSAMAAQELEGLFVDLEGLLFKREWFGLVDFAPVKADRIRYWDKACTPGGGAYTAGVLMARTKDGMFYIEDVTRGQWSPQDRDRIILQTSASDARKYDNQVYIFVEQEGGSGGKEAAQQTVRMLAGYPVRRDVVGRGRRERIVAGEKFPGDAKVVRAQPFASQCEAGNVRLLRRKFCDDFLDELCAFPDSKYADQVDAASAAFNKLVILFAAPGRLEGSRAAIDKIDAHERYGVQVAPDSAQESGRAEGWIKREGWFKK